jgi:hypothetical protein
MASRLTKNKQNKPGASQCRAFSFSSSRVSMIFNDDLSLDYGSDSAELYGNEQHMISTLLSQYAELPDQKKRRTGGTARA